MQERTIARLKNIHSEKKHNDESIAGIAAAIITLTDVVHDSSSAIKSCTVKIDNMTSKLNSVVTTLEVQKVQSIALEKHQNNIHNQLHDQLNILKMRQDIDETIRETEQKDKLKKLEVKLMSNDEYKKLVTEKDKDYHRSRRNYWIGIVVLFILGLLSTCAAKNMKACNVIASQSKEKITMLNATDHYPTDLYNHYH